MVAGIAQMIRIASFLLLAIFSNDAIAAGKVALIIANAQYTDVPRLKNPPADAQLIAASLRNAGFDSVEIALDLDKASMDAALIAFGNKSDGADVALIYYAGHGIEVLGDNYLIPTNAKLRRDRDAAVEAVPLAIVLSMVRGARLRLVLLDACRENPFANAMVRNGAGRSVGRGLARVEPESDTLVVFAAKAGAIAADGNGANSPFAEAVANRVSENNLEIGLLFRLVHDDVVQSTGRGQEPYTYGSLSGSAVYLKSGSSTAKRPAPIKKVAEKRYAPPVSAPVAVAAGSGAAQSLCRVKLLQLEFPILRNDGKNYRNTMNGRPMIALPNCDPATGTFTTAFKILRGSSEGTGGRITDKRISLNFGWFADFNYELRCSVTGVAQEEGLYKGQISCSGPTNGMDAREATISF